MKKSELQELVREVLSESDEKALALALKKELDKELADDGKLNEGLDPISLLGWFLAGNTATNMISKYLAKKLRKYGLNKAADIADWLEHKTHKIEDNMIQSIKGWLSFFIKDEAKRDDVAKAIFAIMLGYLGGKAGMSALDAMSKSSYFSAVASTVKAVLKGKDVKHVLTLI